MPMMNTNNVNQLYNVPNTNGNYSQSLQQPNNAIAMNTSAMNQNTNQPNSNYNNNNNMMMMGGNNNSNNGDQMLSQDNMMNPMFNNMWSDLSQGQSPSIQQHNINNQQQQYHQEEQQQQQLDFQQQSFQMGSSDAEGNESDSPGGNLAYCA